MNSSDINLNHISYYSRKEIVGKQPKHRMRRIIRKFFSASSRQSFTVVNKPLKQLRIACIMDQFSFHSFQPEAKFTQLSPEKWKEEITEFAPDLVFIESAWNGREDQWKNKLNTCSKELKSLIRHCRINKIPTLFWNKEDPAHFETFLPVAKRVDFVFTTEIDLIPSYKRVLKSENVFLLPFATQPLHHNPICRKEIRRQPGCSFAGSYYLKYPQRQKDFESIAHSLSKTIGLDIFDRNLGNNLPDYKFPEKFKKDIVGSLAFDEIGKAYKEYDFSLNLNTVKQSQTMFARRVFELLSSSTVVVSNFSRGLRNFFGNLVISTDDSSQVQKAIRKFTYDESFKRKVLLLGLRKVMNEHTYKRRLEYIVSKVFPGSPLQGGLRPIYVFCKNPSPSQANKVSANFLDQSYQNKKLCFIDESSQTSDSNDLCTRYKDLEELYLNALKDGALIAYFDPNNLYFKNYLADLAHGFEFGEFTVSTKNAYYAHDESSDLKLVDSGKRYTTSNSAKLSRSLIDTAKVSLKEYSVFFEQEGLVEGQLIVSLDEFNYLEKGAQAMPDLETAPCKDLEDVNCGIHIDQILSTAESMPSTLQPNEVNSPLPELDISEFENCILTSPLKSQISIRKKKKHLHISSSLPEPEPKYLYLKTLFQKTDLGLDSNSTVQIKGKGQIDLRIAFIYLDSSGEKISHNIVGSTERFSLTIPHNCEKIRIGLRMVGSGKFRLNRISFGERALPVSSLITKSDTIIITKQYPSYSEVYKYGFLHSRVREYAKRAKIVDILRLTGTNQSHYEFENVDVTNAEKFLIYNTLCERKHKKVFVHFLDRTIWNLVKHHLDHIQLFVWIHGAEAQPWQRRSFEEKILSRKEIERQKKLGANRMKFWKEILNLNHPNMNFIFVSNTLRQEVESDIEMKFPDDRTKVIHNFVDKSVFPYSPKTAEYRKKILVIRPFVSQKYATDLAIDAIKLLGKRPFFKELTFSIYGDGPFFDEHTQDLKKFSNIHLYRTFVHQSDLPDVYKEHGILLVPTRWDSQGLSRDEAMASGLVVVTNNVSAVPEFVDSSSGVLVQPEDPSALADAIEKLYNAIEDFMFISENAAKRTTLQSGVATTIERELRL